MVLGFDVLVEKTPRAKAVFSLETLSSLTSAVVTVTQPPSTSIDSFSISIRTPPLT